MWPVRHHGRMDNCASPSIAMALEPERIRKERRLREIEEDEGTKNTAVVLVTASRRIGYRTVSFRHPHFL